MAEDSEIWLRAWLAVAPSFNAKVADCTRYADVCLEEYRKRFPEEKGFNKVSGNANPV